MTAFTTRKYPVQTTLSYLLPVYFDQDNIASLTSLLREYSQYSPDVLDRIEFVIIDDGSPLDFTLPDDLNLNLTFARVTVDKYWNSGGAKNLGAVLASGKKLLLTDLDFVFPEATLRCLVNKRMPNSRLYKFYVKHEDGHFERPVANIMCMTRARFLGLYGYDEEFCDHYGYEDTMFYRWHRYSGTARIKLPKKYYVMRRNVDREQSYHSKTRDLTENGKIEQRKREEWKTYGVASGHSRKMLRFPWTLVAEHEREPEQPAPKDILWARTWHLRWVGNLLRFF